MNRFSLEILGSSSAGNCYILRVGDKVLLLEAGINFNKIQERLNFRLKEVIGCLVTHEHL